MKKSLGLATGLLLALSSSVSIAADAGSGPNPYTDCGIGAALFPDTHWAAVTSNVIWDIGTTAVTSATASPETCKGKQVAVAQFIQHSYDNLIEDTAKGEGEHMTAMLNIYGCDDASRKAITTAVRSEVAKDVAKSDYAEMTQQQKVENYYFKVNNTISGQFAQSCSA